MLFILPLNSKCPSTCSLFSPSSLLSQFSVIHTLHPATTPVPAKQSFITINHSPNNNLQQVSRAALPWWGCGQRCPCPQGWDSWAAHPAARPVGPWLVLWMAHRQDAEALWSARPTLWPQLLLSRPNGAGSRTGWRRGESEVRWVRRGEKWRKVGKRRES